MTIRERRPEPSGRMNRRALLAGTAGATGLAAFGFTAAANAPAGPGAAAGDRALKGNIRHSVARWTFEDLPIGELAALGNRIGLSAIDLCGPDDWPALKEHGLDSSMCNGAEISLEAGWADPANHDLLVSRYEDHIQLVAENGYRNLICFSGNRGSMSDEEGLENCARGLRRILPKAREAGIVLVMELLNSKVDHPDYMCDRSAFGVELCERLGSSHFALLYDIYHMQIMEGDVIRTIGENHRWFAHYHTAGNPGRHEPDETQELNYPAIVQAIADTGFAGYVAQEFVPTANDPQGAARALRDAVLTCDV